MENTKTICPIVEEDYYMEQRSAKYCHGGYGATCDSEYLKGDVKLRVKILNTIERDANEWYANSSYMPEDGEIVTVHIVDVLDDE